jgi:hypothetical protein
MPDLGRGVWRHVSGLLESGGNRERVSVAVLPPGYEIFIPAATNIATMQSAPLLLIIYAHS